MCLSVPIPRISLIVPLVDWVKAFARAALDAIVEFIADAGRFASEVSLSTKELGSRHAAVLRSALVGVPDGLYLLKSRALSLYNHANSTVAHWKRAVDSICLWLLQKAISTAASPFTAVRAASRLVTSRRGYFDAQPSLWTRLSRFLWKNPRFSSLLDCLDRHAHSFRRAFFVTAIILSLALSDLTRFKSNVHIHCHGDSPHSSTFSVSSLSLYQETSIEEDAFSEENTLIEQDAFILADETFDPAKGDKGCQWASGFSWADDVEEEEAKRGEVIYFFPRKEAPVRQTLYSIPEEVQDEAEEKVFYFEPFEAEQPSALDSDDTTLCEIDPLLCGPLQENEEEFTIHDNETVSDSAQKEQRDEITLAVSSSISDTVLFEDDKNINVKLPVASSVGYSLRGSNAPVFVEESLVLTTWTPDPGLLIASRISEMALFEGDNDIIVKLPVASSASAPRRPSSPQSRTLR